MFNAPTIYTQIPDIEQIYEINDEQSDALDEAIEDLVSNLFVTEATENAVEHWENMLGITPQDDDTLADRRFRVQSKINETLPYSYTVILRKLTALCGEDNYIFTLADDALSCDVKIALETKKKLTYVTQMLENVLPLNMTFTASLLYNTHGFLSALTHAEMAAYTHQSLRDEVIE